MVILLVIVQCECQLNTDKQIALTCVEVTENSEDL